MKCDDLGGKVGQYPFGLPLNYKVSYLWSHYVLNSILLLLDNQRNTASRSV